MNLDKDIENAISSGINYLSQKQKRDGSFSNRVSTSKNFSSYEENQSAFPTSLILSSLNSFPNMGELGKIKNNVSKFILGQRSEFWSWNYWKRNSAESSKSPYPEDLDDTCCAVAALTGYDSKSVSAGAIAKVINLLAYSESKEGGPYFTWITPPDANKGWKDTDLAVNSNVGYFLSLQDVTLPSIVSLTEKAIASDKYDSPYYHSENSVIYFISRWYKGKKKSKALSYLLEKRQCNHSWGNPLETALAISALINFGYEKEKLERSIEYILRHQKSGGWKEHPFVIEFIKKKRKHYAGSSELTTAFCLEALGKFSTPDKKMKSKGKLADSKQQKMRKRIIEMSDRRFSELSSELSESFLAARKKILKGDKGDQIMLLPYYFQKSLGQKEIDERLIAELGATSLYGWTAYTIYDDFLDGEGDPKLLSLANICLRELTSIYSVNFSNDEKFLSFFGKIMDRIDSANSWEASNCRAKIVGSCLMIPERLPEYENMEKLADRSIGHALGAAAILYLNTNETESEEMKNLISFFENYIIARQLNDDAHDWEEDLKRGQLSPAVVSVLKRYAKPNASKNNGELDLKKQLKQLQKIFWYDVIHEICDKALFHIKESRKNLESIKGLKDKAIFESMLGAVEESAQKAVTEQKEMLEFLEEYR
ncbi:MAG: hypothetical protein WC238_00250 [Parcubacteria group bacterium]|jgi:hypothetical protein